jgi:hypothetical protein
LPEATALFKEYQESQKGEEEKLIIRDELRKDQPIDIKNACVRMQIHQEGCAATFFVDDPIVKQIETFMFLRRRLKNTFKNVGLRKFEPFYTWIIHRHLKSVYPLYVGDCVCAKLCPGIEARFIVTRTQGLVHQTNAGLSPIELADFPLNYFGTGSNGKGLFDRYISLFGYSFQEAPKHPTSMDGSFKRPGYVCIKEGRHEGFLCHRPTPFMNAFFFAAANLEVPIQTSGYNREEWIIHETELGRLSVDTSLKSTLRAHYMELKVLSDFQHYAEVLNDGLDSLQKDGPNCSSVDISWYLTDTTRLRLAGKQKYYPTLQIAIDVACGRRQWLFQLLSGTLPNSLVQLIQDHL